MWSFRKKERKSKEDDLSLNFKVKEFLNPSTEWHDLTRDQQQNIKEVVIRLERLRVLFNKPFIINTVGRNNAGFRTPEQNLLVEGAKNSYHMKGKAVDVHPVGVDLRTFALAARDIFGGVILYEHRRFVHLDIRDLEGNKYHPSFN